MGMKIVRLMCQPRLVLDETSGPAHSSVMPFRRFLTPFAAALALLLTSCLDYEEEMWIHSDLSGRAVIKVTLPDIVKDKYAPVQEEFAPAKVKERFAKAKGLTLTSYELDESSRHPIATLDFEFSSLENLSAAAEANGPAVGLMGKFVIEKDASETKVTRTLGTVTPTLELDDKSYVQYVMHFPVDLSYTNTTRHDASHDTVRYHYKLEDVFNQQPVLVNTMPKIKDYRMLLIIGTCLAVAAYVGWLTMRKKPSR